MHGAYVEERDLEARAHKRGAVGGEGEWLDPSRAHGWCHARDVAPVAAHARLHGAISAKAHASVAKISQPGAKERERRPARHRRAERRDRTDHQLGVCLSIKGEREPIVRLRRAVAVQEELDPRRLGRMHRDRGRAAARLGRPEDGRGREDLHQFSMEARRPIVIAIKRIDR